MSVEQHPSPPARSRLLGRATFVYGDPLTTDDGAMVLPVSRTGLVGPVPLGVFVVKDGKATWTPAVDASRIATIGVLTGFAAATLSCLALVRRPPWPDTKIRISRTT